MNSQNRTSEHLDEELVARVQQGDKKAYDLLVIKYQHKIVQLVNRYLKDPSEAQDVAQEAFIKAYRAIGSFRGESTFYTGCTASPSTPPKIIWCRAHGVAPNMKSISKMRRR